MHHTGYFMVCLQEGEKTSGFHAALLRIATLSEVDASVRNLAAICFKRGVERQWSRKKEGITEEEKGAIRAQLLPALSCADKKEVDQLALSVARIARSDYPQKWPDVVPALLSATQTATGPQLLVVLNTLHLIMKELASKRLKADRLLFASAAPGWFQQVHRVWAQHTAALLPSLTAQAGPGNAAEEAQMAMRADTMGGGRQSIDAQTAAAAGVAVETCIRCQPAMEQAFNPNPNQCRHRTDTRSLSLRF